MENLTEAVKDLILTLVNDAMREQDRYVTINFTGNGPIVTIWPLGGEDDDEDCGAIV